jgi:serine/threonine protein kinase
MSTNREFLATYLIKELLGKGAFGSVWKAEDSNTNLEVAVKVIDRR